MFLALVLAVAALLAISEAVWATNDELAAYAAFSERAATYQADLTALPPDNVITDATALTETYLAELDAMAPGACWADRWAYERTATDLLLTYIVAPYSDDEAANASLRLAYALWERYPEVPTTC